MQKPGLHEANSIYKTLLEQYVKIINALEKRKNLQEELKSNKTASEKECLRKSIKYFKTAIADLEKLEKDQRKHYREFLGQRDIKECNEIGDLYIIMLKKRKILGEANRAVINLNTVLNGFNEKVASAAQIIADQDDKSEFSNKLEAFIKERVSVEKQRLEVLGNIDAICKYYDSVAITPLQEIVSQNQGAIASIENDMADHRRFYDDTKEENDTIKVAIEEIRRTPQTTLIRGADSATSVSVDWLNTQRAKLLKEIEDLTSRQESIRMRLMSSPQSREVLVEHNTAMLSTLTLREVARRKGASDQSLEWLEMRNVTKYTASLINVYRKKYETEPNIDKAVASAKFLSDQRLFVEDRETYIAVAADLVHKFDVGLDSFHFNKETFQVEIVNPADAKQRQDLFPLKLSKHGDLQVNGKKLKSSVLASLKGHPDVWILSVRGEAVADRGLFAAKTVMQQSGRVSFKDLGGLDEDMDIFAETAGREFEEETLERFKIVSGTLDKVKDVFVEEEGEYVRFFSAQAENTGRIDVKENDEAVDTWFLNLRELIEQNKLDTLSVFHHRALNNHRGLDRREERRLAIKECILRAALQEEAISEIPAETHRAWKEYFINSYNVNYLVDCIEARIAKDREQKLSLPWRLRT